MWFWCTPNTDEAESIEDARTTVAFYASFEQYESFFAAHGFRDEARRAQAVGRERDIFTRPDLVSDEMVRTFVLCGKPESVRERIERAWRRGRLARRNSARLRDRPREDDAISGRDREALVLNQWAPALGPVMPRLEAVGINASFRWPDATRRTEERKNGTQRSHGTKAVDSLYEPLQARRAREDPDDVRSLEDRFALGERAEPAGDRGLPRHGSQRGESTP